MFWVTGSSVTGRNILNRINKPSVCLNYSLSNDMNCLSVNLQLFVCYEMNLKVAWLKTQSLLFISPSPKTFVYQELLDSLKLRLPIPIPVPIPFFFYFQATFFIGTNLIIIELRSINYAHVINKFRPCHIENFSMPYL